MPTENIQVLKLLLADTYLLYLKTQNYHWNVRGPNFIMFHKLFEEQYEELSEAVDVIAERIRILGKPAPGSFAEFLKLKTLEEAIPATSDAMAMVHDLTKSHTDMGRAIKKFLEKTDVQQDVVTYDLLVARLASHDKNRWMLREHGS